MLEFIVTVLFLTLPVAVTIFFVVCLCKYLIMKRNERMGLSFPDPEERKKNKILLIVSSVIFGVVMTVFIGFALLLIMAIAYM